MAVVVRLTMTRYEVCSHIARLVVDQLAFFAVQWRETRVVDVPAAAELVPEVARGHVHAPLALLGRRRLAQDLPETGQQREIARAFGAI